MRPTFTYFQVKKSFLIINDLIQKRELKEKILINQTQTNFLSNLNFNVTGGKFDLKTDGCLDWLTVFSDKTDSDLILNKNKNKDGNKINIYNDTINEDELYKNFKPHLINQNSLGNALVDFKKCDMNSLPFEISLRICAIRETFEETGLLLAKKKSNINGNNKESNLTTNFIDNGYDFKYWLNKIKNDSKEFLNMCLEYNLIPDIYGLHEWANWITPSVEKYRFNTVFFTCFLSHLPSYEKLIISNEEISKLEVFYLLNLF